MRASDADRERVVARLQQHTAAGRLTLDELSDRIAEVYAARTLGDLATVTRDLPPDATKPGDSGATGHDSRHLIIAFAVAMAVLILLGAFLTLR